MPEGDVPGCSRSSPPDAKCFDGQEDLARKRIEKALDWTEDTDDQ